MTADRFPEIEQAMRAARQAGDGWDDPSPFGYGDRVPIFPAHRLPPWLNTYCCAVAEALQVPVDLPGMLGLTALGAAAGGRCVAEVRPDWREPLNLYTATAMAPGSRKTPVFGRMVAPLELAERRAVEAARPEVIEARVRWGAAKALADKAELDVTHASEAAREEAVHYAAQMRQMAEAVTVPVIPRFLADDATPEALASLLHVHDGRLAMFSDEGEVFSMMAGRYSGVANLAVYLKGHVGSPLRVDRKGRDPEYVEAPALTLGLTVQPAVLEALPSIEGARGRGLLGRFLWSVPPSNIGYRRIDTTPIPEALEARYVDEMMVLVATLAEWKDPAVLVFTAEASAVIAGLQTRLEEQMKPGARLEHISDWAAKLAGHAVRLAGLLHLATNVRTGWAEAVQADVAADAVAFADYLTEHALVAFDTMRRGPVIADAEALLPWITARPSFTRREAYRSNTYRFGSVDSIQAVLTLLDDHGYIRLEPQPPATKRGRPSGPRYTVNPRIRLGEGLDT